MGLEYRPSSSVGFNLFLGGVGGGSTVINPSVFGDIIGNLSRDLEEEGWSLGLGAVYFHDRQATYIGIPMGWMWIFDSGLTLSFDLGPRFRLARNLTWQEGQLRQWSADPTGRLDHDWLFLLA